MPDLPPSRSGSGRLRRRPQKAAMRLRHTGDLFEREKAPPRARLNAAGDELNEPFGKHSVDFGGVRGAKDCAPMRSAEPEIEEIDVTRGRRLRPKKEP